MMVKGWFGRMKWHLQRKKPAIRITAEKYTNLPNRGEGSGVVEIYTPIIAYFGDTVDIKWNICLKYDSYAGITKIYNGDQYVGVLSAEEDYESTHSMHIEYKKEK